MFCFIIPTTNVKAQELEEQIYVLESFTYAPPEMKDCSDSIKQTLSITYEQIKYIPYNELVQTIQEFKNWDITKTKNFVDSIKMCTYSVTPRIGYDIQKVTEWKIITYIQKSEKKL